MDRESAHAVERECVNVLTQYFCHLDRHEFEAAVAFFTPDIVRNIDGDRLAGREGILASMHAFIGDLPMRQVLSNLTATVIDADHAVLTYYLTVYCQQESDFATGKASVVGIDHFCDQEDKLVRTEEGWRIAQRDIVTVLQHVAAPTTR